MSTDTAPIRKDSVSLIQGSNTRPEVSVLEVSIVMPCLNESETLGNCIRQAKQAIQQTGSSGRSLGCGQRQYR